MRALSLLAMRALSFAVAAASLPLTLAACDPPAAPAETPTGAASASGRAPVFTHRLNQVPYDRGRARLANIQAALLAPGLDVAKTTELGFECANVQGDAKALAGEEDPIVTVFFAGVERTCGLDVPLAAAYLDLGAIATKQADHASVKSECLGLKVAMRDFAPKYRENPLVAQIAAKYAAACDTQ